MLSYSTEVVRRNVLKRTIVMQKNNSRLMKTIQPVPSSSIWSLLWNLEPSIPSVGFPGHVFLFSNRQAFKVSDVLNDPIINVSWDGLCVAWNNPIPWDGMGRQVSRIVPSNGKKISVKILDLLRKRMILMIQISLLIIRVKPLKKYCFLFFEWFLVFCWMWDNNFDHGSIFSCYYCTLEFNCWFSINC